MNQKKYDFFTLNINIYMVGILTIIIEIILIKLISKIKFDKLKKGLALE